MLANFWEEPWFTVSGWAFGFVAIPLAIILYRRGKKEKLPWYSTRGGNVFKGYEKMKDYLEVRFKGYGEPIVNLTLTKLVFWNGGRQIIEKGDVVKTEPILIRCKEGAIILSCEIVQADQPSNQFKETVAQDRQSATLTFDHIDHNEGVVLHILHTGTSPEDITMTGKIKEANITRMSNSGSPEASKHIGVHVGALMMFATLGIGSLFIAKEALNSFGGIGVSFAVGAVFAGLIMRQFEWEPRKFAKFHK